MWKSYLKIAYRNLLKNKVFSLINILGLSIGIACCLIIGIYVLHELSYDRFFPDAERTYRVVQEQEQAGNLYQVAITPAPLQERLKTDYPGIQEVTSFSRIFSKMLFQYQNKSFEESRGFHVDSTFFGILPFMIDKGNLQEFSTSPHSILLTESMAYKYFGEEDPIGKVININRKEEFVVQAVLKDAPKNSHLKFDFLLNMQILRSHRDFESWGSNWMYTYVLLNKTVDHQEFEDKIKNLLSQNIEDPNWQPRLYLQALTDIHLHSNFDFNTDIADTANIQNIYLFGAIGLIIILISCINFINLTTARSFQRSKEIGIRKVAGASRIQLIHQLMGELLVYAAISLVLAIILTQMLIPYFEDISGQPLAFDLLNAKKLIYLLIAILMTTGMLAGIYPALFLSGFTTGKILKKSSLLHEGNKSHHLSLKKILVVSQFSLSVILIVGAIIIRQQMHYVLNRNLGFEKEHILYTPIKGELGDDMRYQSFKNALLQQSSIVQVTRSNGLPIHHEGSFEGVEWEGMPSKHQDFLMNYLEVDEAFVETFGLQILSGNNFSPRKLNDTTTFYLVNEFALGVMQMDEPIGKRLEEGVIVGVVKDFNFKSAFIHIEPMLLRFGPENKNSQIAVRTAAGNMAEALNVFKQVYKQFNPDYPVEYYFLDEGIRTLYEQQIRSGKLINLFAVLAVSISCMGLLGLVIFMSEQRTKEIGVRKVMGASVPSIVTLLSKDFLKLVIIGFVIATPIAWYAINRWLENFAYKIDIEWWYFIGAGTLTMLTALLTVSFQSIKAALMNPVESLRRE